MTAGTSAAALQEAFSRCVTMDATLKDQLAAYAGASRRFRPAFAGPIDDLVARLRENGVGVSAPKPGEVMPPFWLPDETGRLVGLEALLARGPLAIVFHRGHWCPYCRISSLALARAHPEIEAHGGQLVAILPEGQAYAAALKAQAGAAFPFLSDLDNGYALSINLVFWVGEELARLYTEIGTDIPRFQGNGAWMLPIPATFVVGRDGRVAARFIDPDYRKRMAIEDLVAAVA